MDRSFTLIKAIRNGTSVSCKSGRYVSKTPAGAAKKAFSQCSKGLEVSEDSPCTMVIHIKETTKSSNNKEFAYKVSRVYQPREVVRNGVSIVYKYAVKVESMNGKQ